MFGRNASSKRSRRKNSYFTANDLLHALEIVDSMFEKILEGIKLASEGKVVKIEVGKPSSYAHYVDLRMSAYRFLRLKPGCGQSAVKSAFRKSVKELRPDLPGKDEQEKEFKEKKYTALQNARDILMRFELNE